jgi:hypothetical protein
MRNGPSDPPQASRSRSGRVARAVWRQLIRRVYPRFDATPALDGQPFPADYPMVPYARSRRFGWTHYGVMIPDLPAPHRFFSIMSIIGTPGALAFDTDHARVDTPRCSATLLSGTAATHPAHFAGYSIERDCELADDGKLIRFGSEVEIHGSYPEFRVLATYAGLRLSIALHATDTVTWFLKTPVYDHLSLLCEYDGTLEYQGERTLVAGLCTYEYAACPSPYLLRDRALPDRAKTPLEFFTYQILNLAEDGVQILLTQIRIAGTLAVNKVYVRGIDAYTRTYRDDDVRFDVAQYRAPPERTPDGRSMELPERFSWTVRDAGGELLRIEAVADTPYTYGLGTGYVGGYRYEGRFRGRTISGRGYIEYIDRRDE